MLVVGSKSGPKLAGLGCLSVWGYAVLATSSCCVDLEDSKVRATSKLRRVRLRCRRYDIVDVEQEVVSFCLVLGGGFVQLSRYEMSQVDVNVSVNVMFLSCAKEQRHYYSATKEADFRNFISSIFPF